MPPGFRFAPGLNPVLRVLDLDVPALVEPLFQQDALAEHLIGFIGISLGAGEPDGGGDKQECKKKTHGLSVDQMTMQQHTSIWGRRIVVGGRPLCGSRRDGTLAGEKGARECPDMVVPEGRID